MKDLSPQVVTRSIRTMSQTQIGWVTFFGTLKVIGETGVCRLCLTDVQGLMGDPDSSFTEAACLVPQDALISVEV